MRTVDMDEARTLLPGLVEEALKGEPFIIAEEGKPRVEVTVKAMEEETSQPKSRIGFLDGQFEIPEDFDTMFREEIIAMFEGKQK